VLAVQLPMLLLELLLAVQVRFCTTVLCRPLLASLTVWLLRLLLLALLRKT